MAGRIGGEKVRCNNQWTQARFNSFIKNNLRNATRKWQPISDCLKKARTRRGFYLCNGCKEEVPASAIIDGKRIKNIAVDHIDPIIDPAVGFTTWDECIDRMFCEQDNLQILCYTCHKEKSDKEKAIAKQRRDKNKEEDDIE